MSHYHSQLYQIFWHIIECGNKNHNLNETLPKSVTLLLFFTSVSSVTTVGKIFSLNFCPLSATVSLRTRELNFKKKIDQKKSCIIPELTSIFFPWKGFLSKGLVFFLKQFNTRQKLEFVIYLSRIKHQFRNCKIHLAWSIYWWNRNEAFQL